MTTARAARATPRRRGPGTRRAGPRSWLTSRRVRSAMPDLGPRERRAGGSAGLAAASSRVARGSRRRQGGAVRGLRARARAWRSCPPSPARRCSTSTVRAPASARQHQPHAPLGGGRRRLAPSGSMRAMTMTGRGCPGCASACSPTAKPRPAARPRVARTQAAVWALKEAGLKLRIGGILLARAPQRAGRVARAPARRRPLDARRAVSPSTRSRWCDQGRSRSDADPVIARVRRLVLGGGQRIARRTHR